MSEWPFQEPVALQMVSEDEVDVDVDSDDVPSDAGSTDVVGFSVSVVVGCGLEA